MCGGKTAHNYSRGDGGGRPQHLFGSYLIRLNMKLLAAIGQNGSYYRYSPGSRLCDYRGTWLAGCHRLMVISDPLFPPAVAYSACSPAECEYFHTVTIIHPRFNDQGRPVIVPLNKVQLRPPTWDPYVLHLPLSLTRTRPRSSSPSLSPPFHPLLSL